MKVIKVNSSINLEVICKHPDTSPRFYNFVAYIDGNDWSMNYKQIRKEVEQVVNKNGYWHEIEIIAIHVVGDEIFKRTILYEEEKKMEDFKTTRTEEEIYEYLMLTNKGYDKGIVFGLIEDAQIVENKYYDELLDHKYEYACACDFINSPFILEDEDDDIELVKVEQIGGIIVYEKQDNKDFEIKVKETIIQLVKNIDFSKWYEQDFMTDYYCTTLKELKELNNNELLGFQNDYVYYIADNLVWEVIQKLNKENNNKTQEIIWKIVRDYLVDCVQKNTPKTSQELYEEYKKEWLTDHNVSEETINKMKSDYWKITEDYVVDEDYTFDEYVFENDGFNGICYVSFDEWYNNEYQQMLEEENNEKEVM